jgi:copper chaperone NosL
MKQTKRRMTMSKTGVIGMVTCCCVALVLVSCGASQPESIKYGEDACAYCKMPIANRSFATALLTTQGKTYKFGSIECLAAFLVAGRVDSDHVHSNWVTDYRNPGHFIKASEASFVLSNQIQSPMGVGLAALATKAEASALSDTLEGVTITWPEIATHVQQVWQLDNAGSL